MKKWLALALVLAMTIAGAALADGMTPGTYEGAGEGNNGEVKVQVTVTEDAITAIEVTEHMETPGISDPAIERLPASIVENQSLAVDTISGATNTSRAILAGVEQALVSAGADVEALKAMETIQLESGLFPAATVPNLSTGFGLFDGAPWEYGDAPHIAPTAWFVMAVNGFNPYDFE